MDSKRHHLALIRSITTRMFAGAFLVRTWSVLIVGALLAITENPEHARFAWLAVFMAIAFWMLEAFLVRERRLFLKIFHRVQNMKESELDLSLDTTPVRSEADAFRSVLFSKALLVHYGVVLALIGGVRLVLHHRL